MVATISTGVIPKEIHGRGVDRTMTDVFKIRFQLVQVHEGVSVEALDSFLIDVPEHVWGVRSSKSEAPYLVAQAFFKRMKKRLDK